MNNLNPRTEATRASYDTIASDYAEEQINQLYPNSFEVYLLDYFIQQLDAQKSVCDLGCGSGQVAAYLHEQAVSTIGIDLSPMMIEQARRLHSDITFQQADMRALPFADNELAGIVAFYSLIHIPRTEMVNVLTELHRAIQHKGYLLLSFYLGREEDHRSEWFDKPVSLDFVLFTLPEMKRYLRQAGFKPEIVIEHSSTYRSEAPYGFILARKDRRRRSS
ncbi:MAG: class I SAM-dependent methyltransferase [Anaerolineae bacterium]